MILHFPNFDSLRLALTSGLVPPGVSGAPVVASFDDTDGIWVKAAASLPRAAQAELRKLGIQTSKNAGSCAGAELSCWPQLLPLRREETLTTPSPQTPVLFELPQGELLPTLVGEMLRLGNDRQAFRWLGGAGETRVLLRVVGPPYYTLLRAFDRQEPTSALRAYVERAPRVWVEVGHTHPLLEQVRQPEGKIVLLRPPRDWLVLDDAPFRDVYDILEFTLPHGPVRWRDTEHHNRMTVPLRLVPGGTSDAAELWVLREDAVAQLDNLVRNASDELLARLLFAVVESGGGQAVILRVRPFRQTAPVLVLKGQDFRPFQKLPNLFLPCGQRLQPKLRRDTVRKLLADDPEQITWLYPHADGTFTPESLADIVFRPLSDWVDYVLDQDRSALNAWIGSTEFDFERFVCKDEEEPARSKKEPKEPRPDRKKSGPEAAADTPAVTASKSRNKEPTAEAEPLAALPQAEPSELQKQLKAIEAEFLALDGALDAPERLALWPRLAILNTALGTDQHRADAALCWVNALWQDSPEAPRWAHTWAAAEARGAAGDRLAAELDRLLAREDPSPGELRTVAACVTWAGHQAEPEPAILQRLNPIRQFLQKHETLLPVRAVWLAWLALCKLSHGDVLALARTRDRLLERLFQHGLTPEVDLPSFLRFAGDHSSERFRAFRDWLLPLPERVRDWVTRLKANSTNPLDARSEASADQLKSKDEDVLDAPTEAYADLILAFGLARLGESKECHKLLERADRMLTKRHDVHDFLLEAFRYRIDQALQGKPPAGTLPTEQLSRLAQMGENDTNRVPVYAINRLRQRSPILEPHEQVNPLEAFLRGHRDDLTETLSALRNLHDREQIAGEITRLFRQQDGPGEGPREARMHILTAGLSLAPRVGQSFALSLLERVPQVCEDVSGMLDQLAVRDKLVTLLERSLFVAAHFEQLVHVQAVVARFHALVESLSGRGDAATHKPADDAKRLEVLDQLAGQCFRGLRKLGMRDDIHALLHHVGEAVLQGESISAWRKKATWPVALRSLLAVAAGWLYFGKEDQARPILEEARLLLYQGKQHFLDQTKLACAYVAALGQGPAEQAMSAIDEMFAKLEGVYDQWHSKIFFSQSQLNVIETVVLAVVTEDFAMGTNARRWLDDEEFLVRRRMHYDLHVLLPHAGAS